MQIIRVEHKLPNHVALLPGGVSTKTAASILGEEDWVTEVLDNNNSMVLVMLNIQFDELIADEDLDLSGL